MAVNSNDLRFERGNLNFQQTLRKRVDEYFTSSGISKNGNAAMVLKTIFVLSGFFATYCIILSNTLTLPWLFLVAGIQGFFTALLGLNIGHDAIHGSYSPKPKVNKFMGALFNLAGASDYIWSISHNIVHHTYTNIPEHDGDIDQIPILRCNPKQALWKIHRFQHFYIFFFYTLTSISWVLLKDYRFFFNEKIGGYKTSHPKGALTRIIIFKILYYIAFIAVPIVVMNVAWYWVVALFVFAHVIEGFTLAMVFQMAHLVDGINFPEPIDETKIENSWMEHQFYTTANFANKQWLPNFLFGGLNFQIEHHLFPNICHIHYTKIAPIVKQTAEEFGLPYMEYETIPKVLSAHVRLLKKLGKNEDYSSVAA